MQKRLPAKLLVLSIIFFSTCTSSREPNKFSDDTFVSIYDLADRREGDSLFLFLEHEDPEVRTDAALAFGSLQDSSAIERLVQVFTNEKDAGVRTAIAFALGQTPSSGSESRITGLIKKETDSKVLATLLEAYGKTTQSWSIAIPTTKDSVIMEGLAWSLYRAGLRGKTDSLDNQVAVALFNSGSKKILFPLMHYFARGAVGFNNSSDQLIRIATTHPDPEIRMPAASSLRKIPADTCLAVLKSIIKNDIDYRVRVNATRGLQSFDFGRTKNTLYELAQDKNFHVAVAASEVIRSKATEDVWFEVANLTAKASNWLVAATALETAFKASGNESVRDEILDRYNATNNVYEKNALLQALQSQKTMYAFVEKQLLENPSPVIKSGAASSLAQMMYAKGITLQDKQKFLATLQAVAQKGDAAVTSILCGPLGDPTQDFQKIIADKTFLTDAKSKMKSPEDLEAIASINSVLKTLGVSFEEPASAYNHPIDWKHVATIKKDQEVIISTNRGPIHLQLHVEEAPGSVSNFLKLAAEGYYNHKVFHRVVPNFVIQGGCKRGDGSGSENYTLRSEFNSRRYGTGTLGMASAGKDTEGTQWFITHSPTPHLDGRYTIFGSLVKGMEAVDKIGIGDEIISVKIVQ